MNKTQVFVYGTLKQGHGNHHFLNGAEFVGKGKISAGLFKMVSLGAFPAILPSYGEKTSSIKGELYVVTDEQLKGLDMLEGYPDFYDRIAVSVELDNGAGWTNALTYYIDHPGKDERPIPSGEW